MKKILYYLSFLIIFGACSTSTEKVVEEKNVIHLEEAIANPVKMNLSEIVDSIVYVPISSKEAFIRDPQLISYSKPYLMVYPGAIFNMQGEFVGHIGSVGQGPGEECNIDGYSNYYDELQNKFYTIGYKIIQFDENRKFTGKEVQITYRDKTNGDKLTKGLSSPYAFLRSGKYNVVINFPDSAFWMDEDLRIVKKERLIPEDLFSNSPGGRVSMPYTFSTNNDTTIFFNCFTDKLYSITEDGIHERWKINIGKAKADNRCFLNYEKELIEDEMAKIVRSSSRDVSSMRIIAENSKLAELIDGKKWIGRAWETNRYVMLTWTELMAFQNWRSGRNMTHWAYHDKKTGETKSIKRLINDMDGCVDFSKYESIIGINDGVLMTAIWPTAVKGYVERKKEKGEAVDPRLEELLVDYDEENNPILVLAYLKK